MPAGFSKTSFLCLFVLLNVLHASAQDFIYKHYNLQDGLANPTIHCIFQDKDGFLWFGTESGLCRYDGSRFKTFTVKDGLPGNDVFGILEDSKGRLWLKLYKNELAYIYKGKIYNRHNDSVLKKINLQYRALGIAEDKEGNIGICEEKVIHIISADHKTVRSIRSLDGKPLNLVNIYTDDSGKLVMCIPGLLYDIENTTLRFRKKLPTAEFMSPNEVLLHPNYIAYGYNDASRLVCLKDTVIWLRNPLGITMKYSPISDSVFSINTLTGGYLFNINSYRLTPFLPGIKITNTFLDREKNLWIGTVGMGIYKISSQTIINKKINDNHNDINYITRQNNRIVVASNYSEMYEYDSKGFNQKPIAPPSDMNYVQKIIYEEKLANNKYFLAHGMGVMTYKNNKLLKSERMFMLKRITPLDDEHVLTSEHQGVFRVRKEDLAVTDTIWNRKSLSALQTGDSTWIGTMNGLFLLKKQQGHYVIIDSLLPGALVTDIKKTSDNLVWISTAEHGLCCIVNGKITRHFSDTSGLPSNNCRTLYVHNNDAWLGTDQGLVKITAQQNNFHLKKYSTSDGLPSNIINCMYIDSNTIYIGTPEGLCFFKESLIETTSMCNLVLTGISIGDRQVDFSNNYFLHDKQRFAIEFSGISFRSEQQMTYRYRIKGIDDNWRNTNHNLLEFATLPYGDYALEIIAINKFGKESAPIKIGLHVNRPFYTTAWFIILAVLIPVSVIVFAYNRRVHLAKQKQVQKLEQENKILELEQMALRAQMNPHFIFNCISTIQQLTTEKDNESIGKFISSFSDLVRKTLDNAPELVIPLNEEINFLASYLELEKIRLEDRFAYTINTAGMHDTEGWMIPNMVIQPFVENAIKHGIRYKKNGQGLIEVAFNQQHALLRCTVTDNGIGRVKAGQMRKESGLQHISKGMGITLKRIESLKTLINEKISISIEDITDDNGNASGTKVIIDFLKVNGHYVENSNN